MSGAIFGYRGLVREILARIKAEQFSRKKVVVVATGGYARLIAGQLPEIDGDSSAPDSRRIADRGEFELIGETRDRLTVHWSRRSVLLHEGNVFPNRTENLRAECNFDLSGMLIRA